jgi:hypothetical protein
MNSRIPFAPALGALAFALTIARPAEAADADWLDELDRHLTVSSADGKYRAHLSGLFDLEAYSLPVPAPGLIYTDRRFLVNPRLTFFLDAQFGPQVYAFAQVRLDRGFDPSDGGSELRLDEYAIRYTPWKDGRLTIQAGKFATSVGNWVPRHYSWDNPFITAPLPYENLTGVWDTAAPPFPGVLLNWGHVSPADFPQPKGEYADKARRLPILWGPSYTSGVAVSGHLGKFDYAVEMKNAALSSRPNSWDATEVGWEHPTFSGRIGYRPSPRWNFGFSASSGAYLAPEAEVTLPAGRDRGDYQQRVFGQDIGFAWHHLQIWAEVYEARFEVPNVGNADTIAYYIEAKYKLTPQLFGAVRWNQQFYDLIDDGLGGRTRWGQDLWRADFGLGYRFSTHSQFKLQYSALRPESTIGGTGHFFAGQYTLKF